MARVGLLEDNERIARLSATMLQFAGHSVTIYDRGRALLDDLIPSRHTLSSFNHPSLMTLSMDVLMLDLQLPDMSGIEVVQYLQSYPHTRTLPLIFCTAASLSDIASILHIAPGSQVVEKPFKLQALVDAVHDALAVQSV
jgi:CheY-like chemotaxis protein